ncbi:MAG: hypothetical protein AB1671_11520 [Thermodesulfobacteriota bacterium]
MKAEKPLPSADADLTAAWAPVFHALGLPPYRVRAEEGMVCIAAPPEDVARLLEPEIRAVLVTHGKALGYRFVTLDLG